MLPLDAVRFATTPTKRYSVSFLLSKGDAWYKGTLTDQNPAQTLGDMNVSLDASYDCKYKASNLVAYQNAVKDGILASYLRSAYLPAAQTNFQYRIEKRDFIVGKISDFLNSNYPDCRVDGDSIVCEQEVVPNLVIYVSD
jgi:hypothetical protein